jgi:ankyrin repeat protein
MPLIRTRILGVLLSLTILAPAHAEDLTSELLAAAGHGDTNEVRRLLDKGADVNARDQLGFTALMFAARSGSTSTTSLLLVRGADVNVRSKVLGYTALMNAAAFGDLEMVSALVAKGAEINAKNDDGVTALTLAEQAGKSDIVNFLKQHGATK